MHKTVAMYWVVAGVAAISVALTLRETRQTAAWAQAAPTTPKPLMLTADAGQLTVAPEIGAMVTLPTLTEREPLLRFTKVGVTNGALTFTGRVTIPARRIISIHSLDPADMLPSQDGTPSIWAGHTLSIVVSEGMTADIPEECVVLGDEALLSAAWGHLIGSNVVSLTYEEKP